MIHQKLGARKQENYLFQGLTNTTLDQDYKHFIDCSIRKSGKLYDCNRCKYVWDHWYGTDIPFFG